MKHGTRTDQPAKGIKVAIHYLYPISHVKTIPSGRTKAELQNLNKAINFNKINGRTVKEIRPDRWAIRHERGGFNG